MKIDDGGPGFPVPAHVPGMSLRDWFAGLAMQGDLATFVDTLPHFPSVAERAYQAADAMLKERNKTSE